MNDKTKSDTCIVRVWSVESPEKYNYRWSIMQDVLLPIPLPHLEPIQERARNGMYCSITYARHILSRYIVQLILKSELLIAN